MKHTKKQKIQQSDTLHKSIQPQVLWKARDENGEFWYFDNLQDAQSCQKHCEHTVPNKKCVIHNFIGQIYTFHTDKEAEYFLQNCFQLP